MSKPPRHVTPPSTPTTGSRTAEAPISPWRSVDPGGVAGRAVHSIFRACVAVGLLAVGLACSAAAAEVPGLQFRCVSDSRGVWRPGEMLAFEVRLLHPSAAGSDDVSPWILNPTGGWGSSITLVVTDPDNRPVSWPLRRGASGAGQSLTLRPFGSVRLGFTWDPLVTDPLPRPGRYQVRVRLAASSGTGWRGQLESEPIRIDVVGITPPTVELVTPVTRTLHRGWPWSCRVWLEQPDDDHAFRLPLPGNPGEWRQSISLDVVGASGQPVSWPWTLTRLRPEYPVYLELGARTDALDFRLPADMTRDLPMGTYRIVARFMMPDDSPRHWTGTAASTPLEVTVAEAPTALTSEWADLKDRLDATEEFLAAAHLRQAALSLPLGATLERIDAIRNSAKPSVRAQTAAERLYRRNPADPEAARLLAMVLSSQDDLDDALDWASVAARANEMSVEPPVDPTATDLSWLLYRQSLEQQPQLLDPALASELAIALASIRGEDLEFANLAQQDAYYALDPRGQWAVSAMASSEYRSADYSAARATGAPDVRSYGDSARAWASRLADAPDEWLELTFSNAVHAAGVRVRQNFNPGAIVRVEVLDTTGTRSVVWQGTDDQTYTRSQIGWFVVTFPRTDQPIRTIRLGLDSVRVRGWNEIDAVQLVAARQVAPPSPPPAPRLTYSLDPDTGALRFSAWPPGFVLQRSGTLQPLDWRTEAVTPPFAFSSDKGPAFFRLSTTP